MNGKEVKLEGEVELCFEVHEDENLDVSDFLFKSFSEINYLFF